MRSKRWRSYFNQLLNTNHKDNFIDIHTSTTDKNLLSCTSKFRYSEIKRYNNEYELEDYSPDNISIEVWKYLEEVEVVWLTKLFHILSEQMLIYKNKCDIQS